MHTGKASDRIIALMSDGHPRTSYEIDALIHGAQATRATWFRTAARCDRLVQRGTFVDCGKDTQGRTVYRLA